MPVKPKKYLGQHFLHDKTIAKKIVAALNIETTKPVLEIGPGTGVLTQFLLEIPDINFTCIEIDNESVLHLNDNYPQLKIIEGDFLKINLCELFPEPFSIIGNFPYNISSQIFFKVLEHRTTVQQVVCMLQKEVAQRIVSPPGTKDYGILSVLLQAYYDIEYLFSVKPGAFIPPPKVNSGVIRLTRNANTSLNCDEKLFFELVKKGFNQRRKTLRNALKPIIGNIAFDHSLLSLRAEQLNVKDYLNLTRQIQEAQNID